MTYPIFEGLPLFEALSSDAKSFKLLLARDDLAVNALHPVSNASALAIAVENNDADKIRLLLDRPDLDVGVLYGEVDQWTPLMYAVKWGKV